VIAPAIAKRISPMLAVADMDETIVFYQEVLGFAPTMTSPEYSIVARNGQTIHFMKAASEDVMKCVRGHTEIYIEGFRHSCAMGACENVQGPLQNQRFI